MKNTASSQERYEKLYSPLITKFSRETYGFNPDGISEPHLPLCGRFYDRQPLKIGLIGMETRTWGNMPSFLKDAEEDPIRASHRIQYEFDKFDFADPSSDWGTKSPSSFQSTILRYIAAIHGIEKWTTLKCRKPESVLASHLWGNVNSLERYHVSAKRNSGNEKDWMAFKKASQLFDSLELILESFLPDIVIIMCSNVPINYYPQGLVLTPVEEYISYGFYGNTNTHIYKTSHPIWLNHKRLLGRTLEYLVRRGKEIREKKVIQSVG